MDQNHQLPPAVNFHLWKPCNYRCRFCFATFNDDEALQAARSGLSKTDALRIIDLLADHGVDKITFAGGEPTLCPHIGPALGRAKARGLTTSIVTNGERLLPLLDSDLRCIDWVALSIDSANEAVNKDLGRGQGHHVERSLRIADRLHREGIRVKLNTVVNALNADEDMTALVRLVRPERWKVFQMLLVGGQNDTANDLAVSGTAFGAFVHRHGHLEQVGVCVVPETNYDMTASYAMIDPLGRFFSDATGRHVYSRPILEVGVTAAFRDIAFSPERFEARGGYYRWGTPIPLTVSGSSVSPLASAREGR